MVFLLGLLALAGASTAASTAASVTIANGTLQGGACAASTANFFFAVPYAEPPVGALRFAAPQPVNSSYGTRNATVRAPSCIQFGTSFAEPQPWSEDCLLLDIWAPANATSTSQLPVKVWLYGGYNQAGGISDAMYNGCFAGQTAIVVSVNYRVGPLGYLALPAAGLSGNYGIQDQLLALQWVQENIAAFGGDPTKVLLFGQSAGAFDTFAISTLPQAPQLIKAAAMESTGGVDFATVAEASAWNEMFAATANCSASSASDAAAAACLRAASPAQLSAANDQMPSGNVPAFGSLLAHLGRGDAWGPLVDGQLIATAPAQAGLRVPAIVGSAVAEGNLFVLGQYGAGALTLGQAQYDQFLTYSFGAGLAATVNQTYSLVRFANSSSSSSSAQLAGFAAMSAVITDYGFRCPGRRALAAAARRGVPVWTYSFNHTPSCAYFSGADGAAVTPQLLAELGPTHTSEIPFVLGLVDSLPPPNGSCSFTAAEKLLSAFLMDAWTSMAASGVPAPAAAWPAFAPNSSLGINVDAAAAAVAGPVDYSMCPFWDQIEAAVVQADAANATTAAAPNATASTSAPATPTATGQAAGRLVMGSVQAAVMLACSALFVLLA